MKRVQNNIERTRQQYENSNHTKDTHKKGQLPRMTKHEQDKHKNKRAYNRDWQDENGY